MTTLEELNQWYADGESIIEGLDTPDTKPSVFHWPTDHHYITRDYGARPDVYRGQIPKRLYHPSHWHDGHEGGDFRTGVDGSIYAIAPGKVYQVGWRRPGHAYGFAMRVMRICWKRYKSKWTRWKKSSPPLASHPTQYHIARGA